MMDRLSIRFSANQLQVLSELKERYKCSYSLLIRAIVGSWLTTNEDILDNILDNNDEEDNGEN